MQGPEMTKCTWHDDDDDGNYPVKGEEVSIEQRAC